MLQNSKDSPNLKLGLRQDFILILINKPINYLHYGKKNLKFKKNDFLR